MIPAWHALIWLAWGAVVGGVFARYLYYVDYTSRKRKRRPRTPKGAYHKATQPSFVIKTPSGDVVTGRWKEPELPPK